MEKECEHELHCIYEEYIDEENINVEFECDLCKTKFAGTVKKI